jgi:sodium transport system ATP-binding protein
MNPIEVKNLTKKFGKKDNIEIALNNINFTVKTGEIHGLLGPNGAGKTTITNILSGILLPTSGTAKILGKDVIKNSIEIRKNIGVCFGGSRFYYPLTCQENLKFHARLHGMKNPELDKRINELAEELAFKSFINKKFADCSKGMRQKIALAKSLLHKPKILLMDEPTIGLDVEVSMIIRNTLKKLSKQGTTILLTTHYLSEIEELCKNITMINKGKVIVKGKISDVKKKLKFSDNISFTTNQKIDFISKIKGIKSWKDLNGEVIIHTNSPEKLIVPLIKQLEKRKIKFNDLQINPATLEEVVLKIMKE